VDTTERPILMNALVNDLLIAFSTGVSFDLQGGHYG
jgi:hypothetical protein